MRTTVTLLASIAAASVLAGCTTANPPPVTSPTSPSLSLSTPSSSRTTSSLEGNVYALRAETTKGFTPIAGTHVTLQFYAGRVALNAGCNTISGTYQAAGGKLVVGRLSTTLKECLGDRDKQDQWLSDFLTAAPAMDLQSTALVLTGPTATLGFIRLVA